MSRQIGGSPTTLPTEIQARFTIILGEGNAITLQKEMVMFTEAVHPWERYKNYRSLHLLCATTFLLAMIAAPPALGGTAAELDLVGQREPAPEELELGQKVDLAEELDLAPSEASSADCPRSTTPVRRTNPTKVRSVTTHSPQRVQFPIKRTVTRYNPPGGGGQIYRVQRDLKPTYAASPPAEPSSRPVQVIYKPAPPGGPTQAQEAAVRDARLEIQEINKQLAANDHAIGRKQAELETAIRNEEDAKLDSDQKSQKLQGVANLPGFGPTHPLWGVYGTLTKDYADSMKELWRWTDMKKRFNYELRSLGEQRKSLQNRRDDKGNEIEMIQRGLSQRPPKWTQGR